MSSKHLKLLCPCSRAPDTPRSAWIPMSFLAQKEEDTKLRGASRDPCWGSYGPALGSGRGASLRSQTLGVSLAVQRQQMLRSTRTRAGSHHNSPAASPAPSTQGRGGHRAHQHTQCTLLPKAGPGAAHSPPCSRVH